MKISEWIQSATDKLNGAGIGTARLDALVLLGDALNHDKSWLLAHPEHELSPRELQQLSTHIKKRSTHTPLAYILGKTEFYGREFIINDHVLEPRPESEAMINILKSLHLPDRPVIVDVGTGSGALAITAKLELPHAVVTALDIMPECLDVTRRNASKHNVVIHCLLSDLLSELSVVPDVIIANLPYVPNSYHINQAAMQEPRVAIFGGEDGLDLYRKMFAQLSTMPKENNPIVLTESLPLQHSLLATIALKHSFKQKLTEDLVQLFERTV